MGANMVNHTRLDETTVLSVELQVKTTALKAMVTRLKLRGMMGELTDIETLCYVILKNVRNL